MSYASLTQVKVRNTPSRQGERPSVRFSKGRRSLVLTDESAGHAFRASLPPHVREDLHDIPAEALWRLTKDDMRGAATTYVAATAAILAFII